MAPSNRGYKWWVVAMLWLVCLFNYADRKSGAFSVTSIQEARIPSNDSGSVPFSHGPFATAETLGNCAPHRWTGGLQTARPALFVRVYPSSIRSRDAGEKPVVCTCDISSKRKRRNWC